MAPDIQYWLCVGVLISILFLKLHSRHLWDIIIPISKTAHAVLFLLIQALAQATLREPRFLSVEDILRDPNIGAADPLDGSADTGSVTFKVTS